MVIFYTVYPYWTASNGRTYKSPTKIHFPRISKLIWIGNALMHWYEIERRSSLSNERKGQGTAAHAAGTGFWFANLYLLVRCWYHYRSYCNNSTVRRVTFREDSVPTVFIHPTIGAEYHHQISTCNNSAIMAGVKDTPEYICKLELGEKLIYTHIVEKHGVDRSTLSRTHWGVQVPDTSPTKINASSPTTRIRASKIYIRHYSPSRAT